MIQIKEIELVQWSDNQECRNKLPILVRRLIRETTPGISSFHFPGNEAVDLKGIDGWTDVSEGSPMVLAGHTIWEIGSNKDVASKANSDYAKRTDEISEEERQQMCFIFVTPRRWLRSCLH